MCTPPCPPPPAGEIPAPPLARPPSLAWLPAQLLQKKGRPGRREGAFPGASSPPAPRGPHRSLARGTQRSGSSLSHPHHCHPAAQHTALITWVAGSWVRACPGACWGWGPRGPGLTGDFGALSSHETPEESLGTEFMRPWHQLCLRRPWALFLLAQRRGWDERVPGP